MSKEYKVNTVVTGEETELMEIGKYEPKKVIVYSKLNCPNCEHVKWGLDAQEVPYEVRMIETNPGASVGEEIKAKGYMEEFRQYGYMSAPVTVFPNGRVMDGFHHGKFVDELRLMGYDL